MIAKKVVKNVYDKIRDKLETSLDDNKIANVIKVTYNDATLEAKLIFEDANHVMTDTETVMNIGISKVLRDMAEKNKIHTIEYDIQEKSVTVVHK